MEVPLGFDFSIPITRERNAENCISLRVRTKEDDLIESAAGEGQRPTAVMDYDITFAAQQEFIDRYIPDNDNITVFSLNKYLGKFVWPTFHLNKEEVIALAARGYNIEFHFDFPQRRGHKLHTIVQA